MEPSIPDFREAAELRAALRKFLRASERVAREEGLTPSRFMLLLMIKTSEAGRSTVTELAERMQRTQSEQDARVYWLELTPVGNERLGRAVSRNGPERRRLLDLLSEAA